MAYNDKRLKTDLEGKPIPQAYNPDIDDYEPVHSTNNALKQVIYGPNGQPISTVGNKLAVRATELEALMQGLATEGKLEQVRQLLSGVATENKLEQARELLEAISGKDFATQTTLAAVLAKLADLESELATEDKLEQVRQLLSGVATEAKLEQARTLLEAISTKDFATQTTLAAVLAKLGQLETEIQAVKANQLSGDQKVQLSGTIDSLLYSLTSDQMIEGGTRYWGENVATTVGSVKSIDISGASQVVVVLENKHDVAVNVATMYLTREAGQALGAGYVNAVYREGKTTSIPAGASVYLDKEIYETLGKIGVGLVLRIERDTAPTSGHLTMLVYGRRN